MIFICEQVHLNVPPLRHKARARPLEGTVIISLKGCICPPPSQLVGCHHFTRHRRVQYIVMLGAPLRTTRQALLSPPLRPLLIIFLPYPLPSWYFSFCYMTFGWLNRGVGDSQGRSRWREGRKYGVREKGKKKTPRKRDKGWGVQTVSELRGFKAKEERRGESCHIHPYHSGLQFSKCLFLRGATVCILTQMGCLCPSSRYAIRIPQSLCRWTTLHHTPQPGPEVPLAWQKTHFLFVEPKDILSTGQKNTSQVVSCGYSSRVVEQEVGRKRSFAAVEYVLTPQVIRIKSKNNLTLDEWLKFYTDYILKPSINV